MAFYESALKSLISDLYPDIGTDPEIHLQKSHSMFGVTYMLYRCTNNKKLYVVSFQGTNISSFEASEENAPWAFLEDDGA